MNSQKFVGLPDDPQVWLKKHAAAERRAAREKAHNHKYKHAVAPGTGAAKVCVYCGGVASGVDHVPPLVAADQWLHPLSGFWLYPACYSCNMLLGFEADECLVRRCQLLQFAWFARLCAANRSDSAAAVLVARETAMGLLRRWTAEHVAGSIGALCRCSVCRFKPLLSESEAAAALELRRADAAAFVQAHLKMP
jgi:hypothetical protein